MLDSYVLAAPDDSVLAQCISNAIATVSLARTTMWKYPVDIANLIEVRPCSDHRTACGLGVYALSDISFQRFSPNNLCSKSKFTALPLINLDISRGFIIHHCVVFQWSLWEHTWGSSTGVTSPAFHKPTTCSHLLGARDATKPMLLWMQERSGIGPGISTTVADHATTWTPSVFYCGVERAGKWPSRSSPPATYAQGKS